MKKYDKEFKKEAVKKYLDGQSVASVSREIGVNENTIHKWKKEILSENGEIDKEKLAMRMDYRARDRERNPKKGGGYLLQKRVTRYEFIEKQRNSYPVRVLCRALKSSEAAY